MKSFEQIVRRFAGVRFSFLLFTFYSSLAMAEDGGHFSRQFLVGTNYCVAIAEGNPEAFSIGSYTVRLYRADDPKYTNEWCTWYLSGQIRDRDGGIEDVVFTNVDGGNEPEVVVTIKNAGTGGFLSADAFKINSDKLIFLKTTGSLESYADCVAELRMMLKVGKKDLVDLIPPKLIQPLEFNYFTVTNIVSHLEASNLMSQRISVGTNDVPAAYEFLGTNSDGARIDVETADEYEAAIKAGYSANNTFEITMASWFDKTAKALKFMAQAQPSLHSLFDTKDFKYLPVSFLNWNESENREKLKQDAAKGMTLVDYERSGKIRNLKFGKNGISFIDDICEYFVTELARGDYGGDGFEDDLIFVATYYQGGSGRYYQTYVVSKTSDKDRQLKLNEFDGAK